MDFEPTKADPDIWLRMSTNWREEEYQEWRVVYVDNLLTIIKYPKDIIDSFIIYDLIYTLSPPDQYLGTNVGKWQFWDGSNFWCMNGRDYTTNVINLSKKLM